MNFYQKIYGVITLLFLTLTAIIFYVCFDAPYSSKFIAESVFLFFSEILIGASVILISGRNDRIAFHSGSYYLCSVLYFFFTLFMAIFIKIDISMKIFVALHMIGLILYMVFILLFYMTEHHVVEQDVSDTSVRRMHKDFYHAMNMIKVKAMTTFPGDQELNRKLHLLVEEFRYAADPSEKTLVQDQAIMSVLQQMGESVLRHDKKSFSIQIEELNNLLEVRKGIL